MPSTITSEINPILHRIEVIVIGIYNDQHRQSFTLVSVTFFTIKNVDELS